MTTLLSWARRRPPGSNERWVLEELDTMQADADPAVDRGAERGAVLDILVRRGVLSSQTAAAAREAPIGAAATVLPPASPRATRPEDETMRHDDPGAVLGTAAVCVAPLALLLPLVGLVDLGAAMWVTTLVLVAGLIVLLTTGGRASVSARGGRGRVTSRAMLAIAVVGLVTPVATLVAAMLAGRFAPEFTGACLAYQSMAVFLLFAGSAIIRRQERRR